MTHRVASSAPASTSRQPSAESRSAGDVDVRAGERANISLGGLQPRPAGPTARLLSNAANREARFVFLLAGASDAESAVRLLGPDTDWERLLQIAWDENAIGALRDYCRRLPSGIVPLDVGRRLACLALERDLRMRVLQKRLEESLSALESAGIRVVLLKGAALVATVYGSFASRMMNDIDLLVDPSQANDAQALMLAVGWMRDPSLPDDEAYATHHHLPPLLDSRGSGLRVEIHRGLLPLGHPFELTMTELWNETRAVTVTGRNALVLQPNHHALHLGIHFAWSHMMRAGAWHAFRDIGAMDRAGLIDWPEFVALALRSGASSCCYWMLRLGRTLANLSVSDEVLRLLSPPLGAAVLDRVERHFVHVLFRRGASQLPVRLDRALWNLAIRPQALGHGDVRPWLVSSELAVARLALDGAPSAGGMTRHAEKVRACSAYLASLMWI